MAARVVEGCCRHESCSKPPSTESNPMSVTRLITTDFPEVYRRHGDGQPVGLSLRLPKFGEGIKHNTVKRFEDGTTELTRGPHAFRHAVVDLGNAGVAHVRVIV